MTTAPGTARPSGSSAGDVRQVRNLAGVLGWALAVVLLTLLWPVLQLLVFAWRFGRLPPGGAAEALVFLPMGLVGAVALVLLLRRSGSPRQAVWTVIGYAVAAPLALVGSLVGGLILPGAVGALVGGAPPLVLGAVLGYLAGARA